MCESANTSKKIRVTVDLPLGSIVLIQEIALTHNVSMTEAIRRSIATLGSINRKIKDNNTILVEDENRNISEFRIPGL